MSRKQELVELCGNHTIKQGRQAVDKSGTCVYRHEVNGEKIGCAASPLLDANMLDDNPSFTCSFSDVVYDHTRYLKDEYKNLTLEETIFVRQIQIIHDTHDTKFKSTDNRLPFTLIDLGKDFRTYCISNFRKLCGYYELDTAWLDQYA